MRTLYRIRYLARLPLHTPYPAVAAALGDILTLLPRHTPLVVDYSGIGRGIYDMLVDYGLEPVGVTITGGEETHWHTGNIATVPKSTLVSNLVRLLHEGSLFVHGDLGEWPALRRELQNFRPEVTRSGRETWNAAGGGHDDLLVAASLASWLLQGGNRPGWGIFQYYREEFEGVGAERYVLAADIGQSRDPTALCVMSRVAGATTEDMLDNPHQPTSAWRYQPTLAPPPQYQPETPSHPDVRTTRTFEPINGPGAKQTYAIGSLEWAAQQQDKNG